jgi:hypothetical protein
VVIGSGPDNRGVQKKKVMGQRARRTGKAQGKRAAIREELELTLRDLEMKHGNFFVMNTDFTHQNSSNL